MSRPRLLYLTQIDAPSPHLARQLHAAGWCLCHLPLRQISYLEQAGWPECGPVRALLVSSKYAAHWSMDHAPHRELPFAAVGGRTHGLMAAAGFPSLLQQVPANAKEMVQALTSRFPGGSTWLFVRGCQALDQIPQGLTARGDRVICHDVYTTSDREGPLAEPEEDALVYFQSPSLVRAYAARFGRAPRWVGAIGATTAAAVEAQGWSVHFQPPRPELDQLAAALWDIGDPDLSHNALSPTTNEQMFSQKG